MGAEAQVAKDIRRFSRVMHQVGPPKHVCMGCSRITEAAERLHGQQQTPCAFCRRLLRTWRYELLGPARLLSRGQTRHQRHRRFGSDSLVIYYTRVVCRTCAAQVAHATETRAAEEQDFWGGKVDASEEGLGAEVELTFSRRPPSTKPLGPGLKSTQRGSCAFGSAPLRLLFNTVLTAHLGQPRLMGRPLLPREVYFGGTRLARAP